MRKPVLYIIRGLPGSGKTTIAKRLRVPLFEADDFFVTTKGVYRYDPRRIGEAHSACRDNVEAYIKIGQDVAVANTFTRRWEYQGYIDMAEHYGYNVQVIECHGPWASTHGVPIEAIERMRERWEPHVPISEEGES